MFTDREHVVMQARCRFQALRETVAAGEDAFIADRLQEFEEEEARWDRFNAAEQARREHSSHNLTNLLRGVA